MTGAIRQMNRWLTSVEELTLVHVGAPERRWSWFQITWAGLHATAIVLHVISVLYHLRRTVTVEGADGLFVAGCPARHIDQPISVTQHRAAPQDDLAPRRRGNEQPRRTARAI